MKHKNQQLETTIKQITKRIFCILFITTLASPVFANDVIFGTASEFNVTSTHKLDSAVMGTDKFVMHYHAAEAGYCRVGTVTGTTIAWGPAAQYDTDVQKQAWKGCVARLQDNKFVL